jgi:hypothetical protein
LGREVLVRNMTSKRYLFATGHGNHQVLGFISSPSGDSQPPREEGDEWDKTDGEKGK